ncbi:MAG: AAA family ATPase [Candidatus Auribacterota bacterium]|jgi:general secretion pathway protein A|nr:AAA family ATPase [Candidatus Auribacterota bacterium]
MYKEFFGFEIMPFNTTPDSSFFFASEQHNEALARLRYAITERKGFVLITGEIGSGKTTVCHTLLSQLGGTVKTALITNTHITGKELLREICTEYELVTSKSTRLQLLHKLNDFLISQLANDNNAVIIIDEAQNLTPRVLEEVRLISNLETDKSKLVQIILMGQPELSEKLELPQLKQLKQRIVTRYHLYPISDDEAEQYIFHRLNIAGSNGHKIFSHSAIQEIILYAGGIPRLINIICDQALLHAYSEGSHKVDDDIVRDVIEEFLPPHKIKEAEEKKLIRQEFIATQGKKGLQYSDEKDKEKKKKAGFWSKFFTRNTTILDDDASNDDDEGILIEFEGINFNKIDQFNRRFGRYLLGKPEKNRLVVRTDYFDKFQSELKKEGIFIETPD